MACRTVAFLSLGHWSKSIFPAISFDKTGNPNSRITSTLLFNGFNGMTPKLLCIFWMLLSSRHDTETAGISSKPIDLKNISKVMLSRPPTEKDVLFIDEIHRLSHSVEEVLYSAMEDFALDIIIGKGPSARSIRLDIAPFTLIGATTKAGALASPLRDRFGVISRLEYYTPESLVFIIKRSAEILNIPIEDRGALEIARRSRGTPRVANRLLKRVRDFAQIKGDGIITDEIADTALAMLEIDKMGLDHIDRNILLTMINKFGGGPVGLETLAAAVSEETDTIGDVYEPYLLQLGFINRTPRGRVVTKLGYEHLGLTKTE